MTEQTQPTDAELEACPFCGNANAIVHDDLLTFRAGCLSCGAAGSMSSYKNGAIAAWNRRAVLAKEGTSAGAGEPIAEVIEELENDGNGWCAKVRWLYNPIPVGEQLYWPQPLIVTQANSLDHLHNLLYAAQTSTGGAQMQAITDARIYLSKLRDANRKQGKPDDYQPKII